MKTVKTVIAVLLMMFALGSIAQTATPHTRHRQVNQQGRIIEGAHSGELTRREAVGLEMQQARIQHDKKVAKSDGVVTRAERRRLQREQNRASRNIYRQKHDAQAR